MHRVFLIVALLAGVFLLAPAAKAETPKGQDSGAGTEKKTNIFEPALDLAIWTIVVFVILFFVLARYAWKPMLAGLQQREHNIRAAQEEAKRDREEAQRLREEVQRKLDGAAAEVRDLLDQGRREAQQLQEDMMNKTRAEIQAERDRLRREIETARDQALQSIMTRAGQLATLVSAKVIRRELTGDDHRRLVDEALTDLAESNVDWKERTRI
jgi:F-type H+-transporting ATPase subunit b